ncbi:MAG TPA: dihydroxy-acid dehydratase, partial [Flavobacterium alvei]|nr:dihydroxy-acid dehydratase [Flavobacterium alvei]
MKNRLANQIICVILTVAFLGFFACSSDSGSTPVVTPVTKTLTVNVSSVEFLTSGNSSGISITTNVDAWTMSSSDTSWIQISKTSGTSGTTSLNITATTNTGTTT